MSLITIGLVDDNPTLLWNTSQNLSIFDEGQILFKANGGFDALDKLNNHQPDVLLKCQKRTASKQQDGLKSVF